MALVCRRRMHHNHFGARRVPWKPELVAAFDLSQHHRSHFR